jgi:hypothetical protein
MNFPGRLNLSPHQHRGRSMNTRLALYFFATLLCFPAYLAFSQDPAGTEKHAIRLEHPAKVVWEMGLQLSVVGGEASGIVATCPLPVEWPEQSIKVLEEDISENVSRVTYKELDGAVRQMIVTVPRLQGGETARVVIRLEVDKSWIEAPSDPSTLTRPTKLTSDLRAYLQPSPFIESRDRKIQSLAQELLDEQRPAWQEIEGLFDWIRDNIEYRFDEKIKSCVQALDDGFGDCEEMSSLFIATCRAAGIPARAVWIPGHTYPEFYLVDRQGQGHWFPCQIAGEGHDFGRMPEYRPILQKGDRFRITGARTPQRYVKPTLTAKNASGTPKIEWILRPVTMPQADAP